MIKKIMMVGGALILCATLAFVIPYFTSGQQLMTGKNVQEQQARFEAELNQLRLKQLREYYEAQWLILAEKNQEQINNYIEAVNELPREEDEGVFNIVPNMEPPTDSNSQEEIAVTEIIENSDSEVTESESKESQGDSGAIAVNSQEEETIDLYEIETIPTAQETEIVTEDIVKDAWINAKISSNRDEIADDDLVLGASIYNQLDTDYLFQLAADGLTDEEDALAKQYLRENLNDEQLNVVQELYYKYVHLLE